MRCAWIAPVLWLALVATGQAVDFGLAPQDSQWPAQLPEQGSRPQYLPGEFWTLHEGPVRTTQPDAVQVAASTDLSASTDFSASTDLSASLAPTPGQYQTEQFYTLDELKTEMKKLAWVKGDYKIVPYGFVAGSLIGESQRTNTGDYTFYVNPVGAGYERSFHVDAKSTRLGVDLFGPMVGCCNNAQTGGRVEFDFQGAFATENKGSVLLRHAYLEVKNEEFRLLAGQTWDVISPLFPGMLMYSVGWGGGNIGYRRAQFRGERYFAVSDGLMFTAQGSLNVDLCGDCVGSTVNQGDHAGWPVVEGRIATTLGPRGKGCRPIEFGVSGHIGEQIWDFYNYGANYWSAPVRVVNNQPERTWSFNADVRIPIGERWGFQGEFFTGENLSTFLGGALQGMNVRRVAATQAFISANTVRSTGGWFEVWYDWRPDLHSHVGLSIDDPFNEDLTSGRIYNQFYFGNLIYDITPKFCLGIEVSQWKTLWIGSPPADSTHVELQAKYGF